MRLRMLGLTSASTALLLVSAVAQADVGLGFKAGTLGFGLEGRWSPVPWLDLRAGANRFELDDSGTQAGINYDATVALDTYYVTGNFRFPLSPFRITAGAFANNNELQMRSKNGSNANIEVGDEVYSAADVGTLRSSTYFADTAPYFGVGYDVELFGKVGLNLDFGLLWQGEPNVTLEADGLFAQQPAFLDALESERAELAEEVSNYKAWPVVSLAFVYNF